MFGGGYFGQAYPGGFPQVGAGAAAITGAGQIATAEAFGSPVIGAVLDAAGIATAEAFGQPAIAAGVEAVGIASAEAFGSPIIGDTPAPEPEASAGGFSQFHRPLPRRRPRRKRDEELVALL